MKPNIFLKTTRGLATLAVVAVMAGCGKHAGPPPKMAFPVKLTPALPMDAPVLINAFGTTKARMSVDIVPQVSGQLLQTFIQDGAVVTNAQPLFQIDPRDYAARVQQAEAARAADQANRELARLTMERNQPLLEKKLISAEDFGTIKTRFAAASAALQADEALLALARLNLARCTIAAPLAGVCSTRTTDDGNLVAAGLTRLVNIRSYDPLFVDFSVSEDYLPLIRRALAAGPVKLELVPRGETNTYTATLDVIENAVSAQTGTIQLRGSAPNPDLKLWAHQFVSVRLHAGTVPGAVMVPEGAVQFGKQGPYLFVVSAQNTAELRPLQLGVRVGDLVQAVSGVQAGENVVVLGQLMLFPGAPVMDATQPPPAAAPTAAKIAREGE
ncbi:MAG: efflux RND transporter periplasmic adaptor subunit [Kiritimatiellaeota bacterium]|nr:efflux RND transporter periplasmic adaptor subunit [Kiritimatiellota bacterium]